ncbi:hypothetical protein AGMMS50229_02060 [Campylobacterota bacterium]|nr:hypothetical protein AGMMS50229_02060 [Campylobacterota bacterium]
MGIVNPYFPSESAEKLAQANDIKVFVETGTCLGGTSKYAAAHFEEVHTIELSEMLFSRAKDSLLALGNITPYLGDSRTVLPTIIAKSKGNILFWLDAHYSAGGTAGKDDPCPLITELDILLRRTQNDIFIIDDAREMIGGGLPHSCRYTA